MYKESIDTPDVFWEKMAYSITWYSKWHQVCIMDLYGPYIKWYIGASLNVCFNCIDRHLLNGHRNRVAIHAVGNELNDVRSYTYFELYQEINKFAHVLSSFGVKKGSTVTIYLPLLPESIIAMLACARIGAIHSYIFAGFSSDSVRTRIIDSESSVVITTDGSYRGNKLVKHKDVINDAVKGLSFVKAVIILTKAKIDIQFNSNTDHYWCDLMEKAPKS